jgi:hypothetical protein
MQIHSLPTKLITRENSDSTTNHATITLAWDVVEIKKKERKYASTKTKESLATTVTEISQDNDNIDIICNQAHNKNDTALMRED